MKRIVLLLLCACAFTANATDLATLGDFNARTLAEIKQARAGRPIVLALWSIHCEPCLRELPQWTSLQIKHPQVPIFLVATDPPKEWKKVQNLLARYKVSGVQTLAFADDFEERVRFSIDRAWRGELPRTYLFDASHGVQARSGLTSAEWLDGWLSTQSAAK